MIMRMTLEQAMSSKHYGDIHVFFDGKKIKHVLEFMTGSNGYILAIENPFRVVGDEVARIQKNGIVTAMVGGKIFK